jgi:hypothetical protein
MPVSSPAVPGQRTCHALGTYATVVTTIPPRWRGLCLRTSS